MKVTLLLPSIIILMAWVDGYSMTGQEALSRFKSRMYGIPKMTGIISWSGKSGQTYTGNFKYMSPGKIYVKFSSPGNKILVTNGKKLWVYNPGSNICGVQDLARGASGGIAGLVSDYMAIVSESGSGYRIKLKNNDRTYSEITLFVDSSFMLKKAIIRDKEGDGFTFTLSNVDTSAAVMKTLFDFNVPANAQVVKNPMNIK